MNQPPRGFLPTVARFASILVCAGMSLIAVWASAQESATTQEGDSSASFVEEGLDTGVRVPIPIEVRGEIEYLVEEDMIIVRATTDRPGLVMYGERSITAQEIVFDQRQQVMTAMGQARLWDYGRIFTGDKIIYDIEGEKGTIFNPGSVGAGDNFFVTGDQLEIDQIPAAERWEGRWWRRPPENAELTRYKVENGTVTSCDLPEPHYHITFEDLEVVPGDRFWVHDVWWNQGGWPLGYLPYFSRSLADHRVAYIFNTGSFSDLGVGVLNKLNVHLDPRLRAAFYADYFADGGFGTGGAYHFDFPEAYGPRGSIRGYWIDQEEANDENLYEDEERYRWAGEYAEDLPWGWRVTAEFQKRSDVDYADDFDRVERVHGVEGDELESDRPSNISVSKSWDSQTVRVTAAKRLDDFFYSSLPGVERLPQARWDMLPTQIGDSGAYIDAHLDYGDLRREQGFNKNTNMVDETERLDGEVRLLHPVRLPWALNLTPFLGYRGTSYFDPRRRADVASSPGLAEDEFDDLTRNVAEAGMTLGTRFTHQWEPQARKPNADPARAAPRHDAYRLVFHPELGYTYYHPDEDLEEENVGDQRFPYIDPVDDIRAQMHRVGTRMTTALQAKSGGQSRTMARYRFGVGMDFFPDDNAVYESFDFEDDFINDDGTPDDSRTTDFRHDLNLIPVDWLNLGHYIRYDIEDSNLRSANTYLAFSRWAGWTTTVGFNTFDTPFVSTESQEEAYLQLLWHLSHKWTVIANSRFDVDDSSIRRQRLTFARDLHDFVAFLELEHKNRRNHDDDFSVDVILRFKGFAEYLPAF